MTIITNYRQLKHRLLNFFVIVDQRLASREELENSIKA